MKPYYTDEHVTLYHGDCREITDWLDADVLITDPPYGIGWKQDLNGYEFRSYVRGADADHDGIANDENTDARDDALAMWGNKPALVFGSPRIAPPSGVKHALVWRKPRDAGVIGSWLPWRRDIEMIYVTGPWPKNKGGLSSVIEGPNGMRSYLPVGAGMHPHTKPLMVMEQLIAAAPPGVIADPFSGGGATLIAAKRLGRRAVGVELDERYCEITANRLAQGVLL